MSSSQAAQRNGRLFVFHTGLPSAQAPGQLKNRMDNKLLGTDKEKVSYHTQLLVRTAACKKRRVLALHSNERNLLCISWLIELT